MVWHQSKLLFTGCTVGTLVGAASLSKDYLFGGPEYEGKETLYGKTYIVTGANTGIGKATAHELAFRGARVVLACRDEKKGQEVSDEISKLTYNRQVVFKQLDLASLQSIRDFADDIIRTEVRVDALVNNAGVKEPKKRKLTLEGFELQMGVNHFGHFLLTNLLIGKLKSASPSRIVNLTDIAHRRGKMNFDDLNSESKYVPAEAYNQSKLAIALFTKELGRRLEGSGISSYAVHPGIVRTEINRHMGVDNSLMAKLFVKPFFWFLHKTPEQGARTVIYCLVKLDLESQSGGYFKDCGERAYSESASDPDLAKRLWMTSEVWTGLKEFPDLGVEKESDENDVTRVGEVGKLAENSHVLSKCNENQSSCLDKENEQTVKQSVMCIG